jgi:hypothetical protein
MGGFGSTRWGSSTKDTVEGNRRLDINRLRQAGCSAAGLFGQLGMEAGW